MEEKWKKKKLAIPYKTYSEWVHFLNEFKTTDQIYVQSSSSSSSSSASVNWKRVLLQHISFWLFRCSCKSVCLSSLLMCIQSLLFFRLLSFFFVSFRKRGCFFVFFINIFPCIVYFWLLHCVCQPCPSIICCVIPFSKTKFIEFLVDFLSFNCHFNVLIFMFFINKIYLGVGWKVEF